VSVNLVIKNATRLRRIVICALPRSTIFFHVISQTTHFLKKKVIEHKMGVLISTTTFV
jgi:hypothetical protein